MGIGGYGTPDLTALGVGVVVAQNAAPEEFAFWELAPMAVQIVELTPDPTISPHDALSSTISFVGVLSNGSQEWKFSLSDATTASWWNNTELCSTGTCTLSTFDSADWIEGVPEYTGGGPSLLPAFQQFNFLAEYGLNSSSSWNGPTDGITVVLRNTTASGGDLVLPSGFGFEGYGGSQFWISYLVDTIDPVFAGGCCGISPTTAGTGQVLNASVRLDATNGFTGTGVARLSLGLELYGGSESCFDPPGANTGFAGVQGTAKYYTSLAVCASLPSATYSAQYLVYYDPPGVVDGAPGSLLLETSGSVFHAIAVEAGTVTAPQISPPSGGIDAGGTLRISATFAPNGNLSGPFQFDFPGAPDGCQGDYPATGLNVTATCTPFNSGSYSIGAEVFTTTFVGIVSSTSTTVNVNPAVTANLSASSSRIEFHGSTTLYANLTGGNGNYQYNWTGLPLGCTGADEPVLICAPTFFGNYTVGLNATDDTGAPPASALLGLSVALPIVVLLVDKYVTVPAGFSTELIGASVGGFGPYAYAWSGLPGGCHSANLSQLNCTPTETGTFSIELTVTDTLGASNSTHWLLNVSSTATVVANVFSDIGLGVLILAVGGALAVTGVLIARSRRRRNRQPSTDVTEEPAPPPDLP